MTNAPAAKAPIGQPRPDVAKVRQCLRCKATFPSEWSGERICARCKGTSAWRSGLRVGAGLSNSRR